MAVCRLRLAQGLVKYGGHLTHFWGGSRPPWSIPFYWPPGGSHSVDRIVADNACELRCSLMYWALAGQYPLKDYSSPVNPKGLLYSVGCE